MTVTLAALRNVALEATADRPAGDALDAQTAALVGLGVAVAVTSLDRGAIDGALATALAAGASVAQVEETVALVSGLGVHSLMVALPLLAARVKTDAGPLDPARQALWDRYVGKDPYWVSFEREVPGFLDAMVRLAPETFRAFFEYCAVPWRGGTVRAYTKELVALASDATPTHRFLPGFRLHLRNAIKLGAGQRAVLEALDIAAAAPPHAGA